MSHHVDPHCKFLHSCQGFLCPVGPQYFSDGKSITVDIYQSYNDAINQVDNLNSFPGIVFDLYSSMARALGL